MFQKLRTDLVKKLSSIKVLLVNADMIPADGEESFSDRESGDFGGIRELEKLGVKSIAFFTTTKNAVIDAVFRLGIDLIVQVVSTKAAFYSKLKSKHRVDDKEVAFIGGTLSDIPIIEKAGFSVAFPDAPLEVKAKSYYVAYGMGREAIKEVVGLIIKARSSGG
ncbi:3-deoxy-D-manno-octulosonate 8-phosphate phosphatase KdsC [bacterium HR37]|nr:3-deoxy-D-manno-octulosonate 8-phosphate phosphatase KdsC [bacterium HR37]